MKELRELGKIIRKIRLNNNLTMEEISKKADITRATLMKIENGNSSCAIGTYFKIMGILNIKCDFSFQNKKGRKRKRATRNILKIDKKINRFVVFVIEIFGEYINKPTDYVFEKLEQKGLIDLLYDDYEDLHGMSPEYINNYLKSCFKKGEL